MSEDKKPKRFDLAALDVSQKSEDGRALEICDPDTGEELGISIVLRGSESDTYKRTARAQINKYRNMPKSKMTIEQIEADAIELLASCTVSWSGIDLDGAELPCNRANATMLYTRFGWIKRLVDAFVSDEANYRRD